MDKTKLGKLGENLAIKIYKNEGHEILHKNLRTPFGEIDLITEYKDQIYIIEVKAAQSTLINPIYSWFKTQRRNLIKSTRYLLATDHLTSIENLTCHFVSFEITKANKVRCKRYKNIPLTL